MNIWKIKNVSDIQVKVAVAAKNTVTKGVILEPGQFCLSEGRMTRSIDAQEKRRFISVEREFDNSDNLNLAEAYDMSELDIAKEKTDEYSK
jgi:hypothetical protein